MKKLFLSCTVLAIAPSITHAEAPGAMEVGTLMGQEMCAELVVNQTLMGDDAAYGRVYDQLYAAYGTDAENLFLELGLLFNEPAAVIANDPYVLAMFQGIFRHIIENEDCFRTFLEYEVFQEDVPSETPLLSESDNNKG